MGPARTLGSAGIVVALLACGSSPPHAAPSASQTTIALAPTVAPSTSAAPAASALPTASAGENEATCQTDADCVLLKEDACCAPSPCDETLAAMTVEAAKRKHEACARKDCYVPKPKVCTAKDRRVIAACRGGVCAVVVP